MCKSFSCTFLENEFTEVMRLSSIHTHREATCSTHKVCLCLLCMTFVHLFPSSGLHSRVAKVMSSYICTLVSGITNLTDSTGNLCY